MADKIVYFGHYCSVCAYSTLPETANPCDECLGQPVNEDSHKPVCFKERKNSASQK